MQTNNRRNVNYDEVLDAKFGKEGTQERARAEESAYAFYFAQNVKVGLKRGEW